MSETFGETTAHGSADPGPTEPQTAPESHPEVTQPGPQDDAADRAEYEAWKRERQQTVRPNPSDGPPTEPTKDDEFGYYVHLADGRVERVKDAPVGNLFNEGDEENPKHTQIIGIYPR